MMGRFYADLNRLKHDELLKQPKSQFFETLIELHIMSSVNKSPQKQSSLITDRDGDIIMTETISTLGPVSPFKEKFSFEWFSFDGNKASSKTPLFSPISPASTASRKLSVSTASPSSYFSEQSPTSLGSSKPKVYDLNERRPRASQLVLPPPPSSPLHWVWQCHMCRNRYQLAVTRRCLVDGHYYCSGVTTTNQRNAKRRKANRSCTSEFDYVGWQDWGRWSRKCKALHDYAAGKENGPVLQGCEGCSFPSQCRYESRPRQEKLEFGDYIDDSDLDAMMVDEVEELISPERRAFEEERLTRSSKSTISLPEMVQTQTPSVQAVKEVKSSPQVEATQNSSSAVDKGNTTSKRQRFYSGLTSSLTSVSSVRENSEKGKFDPTLPSVSTQSTKAEKEAQKDRDEGYINAIEANLKSAFPGEPQTNKPITRRSQSSPQVQTMSSKVKMRKRLNSKSNDPEFEVSTEHNAKSGVGLTRTNSEQSLITDLFQQVKSNSTLKDRISVDKANRASSEADIAEFLQLGSPTANQTASKSISIDPVKARRPPQHFEDIQLTPKEIRLGGVFEMLPPSIGVGEDAKVDTDPVKRDPQPPEEGAKSSDKVIAMGLGAGLFSFGFGRK